MERTKFLSSTVRSAGYNELSSILELEFTSRAIYHYFNVPASIYIRLMAAPSKGSFFNAFIKDNYRCTKIKG